MPVFTRGHLYVDVIQLPRCGAQKETFMCLKKQRKVFLFLMETGARWHQAEKKNTHIPDIVINEL